LVFGSGIVALITYEGTWRHLKRRTACSKKLRNKLTLKFHPSKVSYRKYYIMDIECWQTFVRPCGNILKEKQGAQKFKNLTLKFHPSKVSNCKYHIMDIECWQKFVRTYGNIPKEERGAQKFKKLTFKFHPSKVSHQSRCAPCLLCVLSTLKTRTVKFGDQLRQLGVRDKEKWNAKKNNI
jgi:hypothetical protein